MTDFAILIPHYNQPLELHQCIASCAAAQSAAQGHLVVVDDGSAPEHTPTAIIDHWKEKGAFRKITFVKNPHNAGVSATLNRGLAEITETYFLRIDSDDRMLGKRIEEQISRLRAGFDLIFSEAIIVYEGEEIAISKSPPLSLIRTLMPVKNYLMHPTLAARTDFFKSRGGYPAISKTEDWDFWKAHLHDARVEFVKQPLIKLGLHLDSASNARFHSGRAVSRNFRLKTALRYWDAEAALNEASKLGWHYYLITLIAPNPYKLLAYARALKLRMQKLTK